ncbi:MAG TPA: glycogen synthase GlgA [Methylophilaceae bacterium]|nr:glycogen synthase GlgA [Methylophilaceae bacterium]
MRILFVTSEAYPLVKTGGLGDVSGSLPAALRELGEDVRILIPGYPAVLEKIRDGKPVATVHELPLVGSATLILGEMPETGVPIMALDCPALYQRAGGPYLDTSGRDWEDNPIRFGVFSRVAALMSCGHSPLGDWIPDVVHCNDWQSGLTSAYLHYMRASGAQDCADSVMSIHNLIFQGCFPAEWVSRLWLPPESFQMHGLEYYGQLSFLKAGIYYADTITTVSPTYAQEIQTPEFGFGLEGLLAGRKQDVHGILNGIDTSEWNPAQDPHLIRNYDATDLEGKQPVKQALQATLGLKQQDVPLLGVVSRLTQQKGLDMLLAVAEPLLEQGCQLALLGSGDPGLEEGFRQLAMRHPERVGVSIGYNEALSHQIMAGADIFIMPSRFEPCGLNQMYGLRYGTPPVVTHTGGLADSVQDTTQTSLVDGSATGFVMAEANQNDLLSTTLRALHYYGQAKNWHKIQQNGMRKDLSWGKSARAYRDIYQSLSRRS